ncbi:superoxide dismutase [Halobacillus sp. Marseille-Q1614]|uniref:superoxide dismutase n=1 Tax=Halobacillus sp. Marseille-Q1614 TaxID=2709134 RepID=UPI0020C3FBE1|nr:superoxide dismutase [Halobacillus sp. Marseille-Q1614]
MSENQALVKYLRDMEVWANDVAKGYDSKALSEKESLQEDLDVLLDQIEECSQDLAAFNLEKAWELEQIAVKVNQRFSSERQDSPVPIGGHTLPPLPYGYDALEPYISGKIMRLHHDKHHKSYVDGLNKAEKEMEKARKNGSYDLIKHWEREAAFNGAGHYLHTIFWDVMSPQGGGKPGGELLKEIERSFGSFQKFKAHFSEAAKKVEGVGWAILVWAPRSHRLEILQAEKHQNLSQWDVIPLMPLDVWEHAYYLQYENDRGKYVDNWWNVVNWNAVRDRYQKAKQVKWQKF